MMRAIGYDVNQIAQVRKSLAEREQPVDVPRDFKDWRPTLALLANPEGDRAMVCKLIRDMPYYVYQKSPEVFVGLSEVARGAGLYPRFGRKDITFMANYLEMQKEPVGHAVDKDKSGKRKGDRHYFFTLKMYEEEVKQLLLSAKGPRFEAMRQAPIRVIGPMPEKMPNTTDLIGRRVKREIIREYSGVLGLLGPYGIISTTQLRSLETNLEGLIGPNPPVSVFLERHTFFVANVDSQALGVHLGKQLEAVRRLDMSAPDKM